MRTELFLTQYGNVKALFALCKLVGIFYKLQDAFQDLFFFFFFFLMWTIFKVFIEFVTVLLVLCFGFFGQEACGTISSPTRDQTTLPCVRR